MNTSLRTAVVATAHCLTGCAIGEVLGMVVGISLGWGVLATVGLAVGLAFFFGYMLAMLPLLRSGMKAREAVKIAVAADTVSIATMELVDNLVMVFVPGAMEAGLLSVLFWVSLGFALLVAFIITVPVNYWLITHGRGHAVAHRHHSHDHGHRHH